MTSQHVLLTTDVVGGVWDFCVALAVQLRSSSQVTLLALGEPTPEQRRTAEHTGAALISVPLKLEWMQDADADIRQTRQLVRTMAHELRPSVIHANQFAAACADVDIPVVLTVHSDVLSWRRWTRGSTEVPAEWRAYHALVREALARADTVVAVSRFLAGELALLYGVDRPIEVIHNGWPIPSEEASDAPQGVPAGARLGQPHPLAGSPQLGKDWLGHAPQGEPHWGSTLLAGRLWDAAKNIGLAAEAARGWDPGEVYLAGERTHPEGGQAEVPPPLTPLGFLARADMDACLRRAAVYLSTARYDPFGLLPLQAALNGCALLLSDIPSYRELWDGAACFFHSSDATDLRHQWQALLADAGRLAASQRRAYERATTRYSARRMADAYRHLYARQRVAA